MGKNALVQAAHRPLVNCRLKMLSVGKEHVFCFLLSELRPAKNDRSKDTDPDFLQKYMLGCSACNEDIGNLTMFSAALG